jgi:hypothetical protein
MSSAYHCRVGYGGSKSASEGGFEPPVMSFSGVAKDAYMGPKSSSNFLLAISVHMYLLVFGED